MNFRVIIISGLLRHSFPVWYWEVSYYCNIIYLYILCTSDSLSHTYKYPHTVYGSMCTDYRYILSS